jgi:hypothetical protein
MNRNVERAFNAMPAVPDSVVLSNSLFGSRLSVESRATSAE